MADFGKQPRRLAALAILAGLCAATPAFGQESDSFDPAFNLSLHETVDAWQTVSGGLRRGGTTLNKLQLIASWRALRFDDPGLTVNVQVFRTNGERLSSHTGDVQTVSNIEALSTDRLFEAWAEQMFGQTGRGGLSVRAGLMDLNNAFDSIDPAALFIDSSHGIGPDLSKSGVNGPSIFPVSSVGVRVTWTPTPAWTLKGAAFDGVAGDPGDPEAFAAVRLAGDDGALLIGQADRKLGADGQASLGVWRYTARVPAPTDGVARIDTGVYGFVEGAIPRLPGVTGWVRAGEASSKAQAISGYFGAGLVKAEPLPGRTNDQLGFAVSRAEISAPMRRAFGLPSAETTLEATYQLAFGQRVSLQPDVQYIIHPASQSGVRNALAVGLRLSVLASVSP